MMLRGVLTIAKQRLGLLVLCGATAVAGQALAGCGGSGGGGQGAGSANGGPVTLTFANWAAAEDTTRPGMLKVITAFEKSHPNVKIRSQAISFSDIGKNLVLATRSGNPPDVAQLSGNDTFAVAATQGLANLDDLLGDVKGELLPTDVQSGVVNGVWVAMPWADAPQGFWFNKKLLAQAGISSAPTTIDELDADMAKIKSKLKGVIPLGIDTSNRSFGLASQWPWMKTFGAQPFDSNGKVTADTPQMKQYLQWIRDVVQKGYTLPNRKIGDFRPLAAQNKVAFVFDQPVLQSVAQATNGMGDAEFYKTWGVTKQPTGPTGQSFSTQFGHQLVIFKKAVDSGKGKAAAEFVRYLATSPYAIKTLTIKTESQLPPLKDPPAEVRSLLDTPAFGVFLKVIPSTISKPAYGPVFSAGFSPAMAGVQNAYTSEQPLDAIVTDMQTNIGQATA